MTLRTAGAKPRMSIAILALVGLLTGGCGSSSERDLAASPRGSAVAAVGDSPPAAARSLGEAVASKPYRNDGDHERVGDADADNNADNDGDPRLDYLPSDAQAHENHRYLDADDRDQLAYGSPASAAEERAVAAVVERYYGMAAAGDGSGACGLLLRPLAAAVVTDYGHNGPSYLRSGKTCAAVLALLFKHYRAQLAEGVAVTDVRIAGDQADALLGSRAFPASFLVLQREGGAWRVAQLLSNENVLP
jgi:uncharacterized membrane protein